jgi:hypothetical protein
MEDYTEDFSCSLLGGEVKLNMEGWLPVILLSDNEGAVRYEFTLWATPLPTVRSWRNAFNWPTEGENYLNWIAVKAPTMATKRRKPRCPSSKPARRLARA